MFRPVALAVVLASVLATSIAAMSTSASPPPKPQPSEMAFVTHIQQTLMAKYPKAQDAINAGYFRFSDEDADGAISYANLHWTSTDWDHPSQLWYDAHGNLLGADFSQPYVAKKPPHLWGVNPARWQYFEEHVHYVLVGAHGLTGYEHGLRASAFVKAGGSLADPQASTLVKMGKVKSASQVAHIFTFPAIWDLIVWVKPNPAGAFAEKNPLVHPVSSSHSMM
jgi:hypothetical protein